MGGHLADGAEGGIGSSADKAIGDESTERTGEMESFARTQEETSTERASDLTGG